MKEKYKFDLSSKEDLSYGQYVFIKISIEPKMEATEQEQRTFLVNSIAKGLRIRLASQGITGAAYLEADFLDPEKYPPMKIEWEPRSYYIPSAPSMITQFTDSLEEILGKFEVINVKGIAEGLEQALGSVKKVFEDNQVAKITEEVAHLLVELRETNKRLGPLLSDASTTMATVQRITTETEKPLTQSLKSLKELPEIFAQLKLTTLRFSNLLANEEQSIGVSAENVRLITENLRELTENARNYPAQVLFGGPPPHSVLGGRK
ncbi:MAG: hypothetical protein HND49_10825 [Planctomycetes bacterium]|nr:hypothetical protein [Planctomycetota bacterium]